MKTNNFYKKFTNGKLTILAIVFSIVLLSANDVFAADGDLDATFDGDGKVSTDIGANFDSATNAAQQPDGKIVTVGTTRSIDSSQDNLLLVRYNPNGSLDTTFGTGGIVRTAFTTGTAAAAALKMDVASNGRIALGGTVNPQTTPAQPGIAVYNADGSPDTTFGTDGKVLVAGTNVNFFGSIARQADGKIVLVGRRLRENESSPAAYFQRYTASGAVDTAFGTNGEVFPTSANRPLITLNDAAIQPDGKILGFGAGFVSFQGTLAAWLTVVRLSPNGAFDSSFGTNGIVNTPFNTGFSGNQSQALTGFLQTDGRIVAAGTETVINPTTGTANVNIAVARYNNTAGTAPVNNPTLRYADFDGDGKTDVSVFRAGTWYVNPSSNPSFAPDSPQAFYGVQFGQTGDVTVPADYDGDGKSDIAVWRGGNLAYFYILNSSNNTFRTEQFGTSGDNPTVAGDWDADGKADLAVYRNGAQSYFYYRPSTQPGVNFVPVQWGTSGDTPIFGDFDGDRKLDPAVYRPSQNAFYVRRSSDAAIIYKQWGNAQTDAIFAGDFDGDGKSDFAVQRFSGAEAGTWYVAQSGGATQAFRWGTGTDVPVPADYDGDGKMDFAVFRRSDRTWYVFQSATGTPLYSSFGSSSDFPLPLNLIR